MYIHKVKYYETDKMGITHHSNYIRIMEEARVEFLRELGISFADMEKGGVLSPVVSVNCSYKATTTFDDEIAVEVGIASYSGVRLVFEYTMKTTHDQKLVCTAASEHCFVDKGGKILSLAKALPDCDRILGENLK